MSPCLLVSLKEKGLSQERQTFVNLYDKYLHGFATHDFWILSCATTMLLSLILFSSLLLLFVGKSKHFISNCKIFCQKFYKKLTTAEISALVLSPYFSTCDEGLHVFEVDHENRPDFLTFLVYYLVISFIFFIFADK